MACGHWLNFTAAELSMKRCASSGTIQYLELFMPGSEKLLQSAEADTFLITALALFQFKKCINVSSAYLSSRRAGIAVWSTRKCSPHHRLSSHLAATIVKKTTNQETRFT